MPASERRAAGGPDRSPDSTGVSPRVSWLVGGLRVVDRGRNCLIVALFSIMTVTYFTVFASRYIPVIGAVNWAEELTRYLNIWLLFLAFGYILRRHQHISMEVVVNVLPGSIRRALRCVNDGLLLAFLAIWLVYGWVMVDLNMTQEAPSLKLVGVDFLMGWPVRMGWPYLAIPAGAVLTALDLLATYVDPDLRRTDTAPDMLEAPPL